MNRTKKSKKQMSTNQQAELYRLAQAEALMRGGDVRVDHEGKILPEVSHLGRKKRKGTPEAVVYARASGPNAYGAIQSQLAACRSWALERGMGVLDEFADVATGSEARAGLHALLNLVERHAGAIEVLVTDDGRLGRSLPVVRAVFGKLKRAGVGIREVSDPRREEP